MNTYVCCWIIDDLETGPRIMTRIQDGKTRGEAAENAVLAWFVDGGTLMQSHVTYTVTVIHASFSAGGAVTFASTTGMLEGAVQYACQTYVVRVETQPCAKAVPS